jgi:hypothetical protein
MRARQRTVGLAIGPARRSWRPCRDVAPVGTHGFLCLPPVCTVCAPRHGIDRLCSKEGSRMDRDSLGYAGWRDYSPLLLNPLRPARRRADLARYVWHCPAERLVARYRQHVRPGHLDVGPGTGVLPRPIRPDDRQRRDDRRPEPERPAPRSQAPCGPRCDRRRGERPRAAAGTSWLPVGGAPSRDPLPARAVRAPGARRGERRARPRARRGVLRGLGPGPRRPLLPARPRVLATFNRQGRFDNLDDSEESLRAMLAQSFERVELSTIGSIAVFSATGPKTAA